MYCCMQLGLAYKKEKSTSIVNFHGCEQRESEFSTRANDEHTQHTAYAESTQTCSNERARTRWRNEPATTVEWERESVCARACACVCEALSLARRAERVLSALSLSTHRVRFSFAHSFCWFASLFWLLLLAGCLCRRCCRRCRCRVCRGSSTGKRCCRRRRRCSLPSLCAAVARLAIQLSLVESQSKHNQLRFGGTFVRWQRFG